ncbi:MAG: hypothetical protein MUP55_02685 [Candidatus Aenigmarchaeota archaeon]|nr:hypothetical protein [Candidatus Aenigmarchaeota archaeon]
MIRRGSIIGNILGQTQTGQKKDDQNTERLRKLHEAVRDLNDTLKTMKSDFVDNYTEKYDKKLVSEHIGMLEDILVELTIELKNVNQNLIKLTTTSGLVSMAFSGGADKILNDIAGEVDKLNGFIKALMQEYIPKDVPKNIPVDIPSESKTQT